ncbi:Lrp/AsnC family transcriptional regulator [Halomonas campisalis]|uniref:Lrp/AsnC family transcriptional regulator n=1 Tax=Billgrantia campisalis TaxID=74661 RepID=A0ABS9PBC5_9GAMM|nr:Lrp/AsnC family transcriptional regulator [Halomonas campisalis]MCG6659075.1 Lrp/AsnC family transcriptional regulator [Halomonas campisalis]MDR5863891.1 Lrp/AsnC family transcriptional regulator [Halomonas campisalis]
MEMLDRFDRRILHALQRDARLTLAALAEAVSLSPSQCSRRIARLEAQGVIQGHALRLAPEALGLKVTAFIFLSVDKGRMASPREAVAALLARDEVIDCHAVTGHHDFILKVMVADLAELSLFLSTTVSPMEGIRDIATQVAMNTLKEGGPLKVSP